MTNNKMRIIFVKFSRVHGLQDGVSILEFKVGFKISISDVETVREDGQDAGTAASLFKYGVPVS